MIRASGGRFVWNVVISGILSLVSLWERAKVSSLVIDEALVIWLVIRSDG